MSFHLGTLITAGLFGALLLVGSINPVFAGDGCGKDKRDKSTSSLTKPTVIADERAG